MAVLEGKHSLLQPDQILIAFPFPNQEGVLPSNAMIAAKALSLTPNFGIDLDQFKAGES